MPKVYIIGVTSEGAAGLSARALRLLKRAEVVFGGQRLLDMFPSLKGEKFGIGKNLAEVAGLIERDMTTKRVVVLASGDPGFYGIAAYLVGKLGKPRFEIIPNVSAMQLAFARIRESWTGAVFVSAHGRLAGEIVEAVRHHDKIGIFTGGENTPSVIAGILLASGLRGYRVYVCQDLGSRAEKIIKTDLRHLSGRDFAPLNVMILIKEKSQPVVAAWAPGIPDDEFYQRKPLDGLITKLEVRAVSLAKLRLGEGSVVWDIGAGSGAVSIEAALLARQGSVYAVEKNAADATIIKKNIRKFGVSNVTVTQALAPDGLESLPAPAAVFIGGSGGNMAEILAVTCRRLKPGGRIVINLVVMENLTIAVNTLKANGFTVEISLVNIARSASILELTRFSALNPVYVVAAYKKEGSGTSE